MTRHCVCVSAAALATSVAAPSASAGLSVLIDFEAFPSGTIITNQFPEVTFSANAGAENAVSGPGLTGQFICSNPVGELTCLEDTYLDFTNPVNDLTFQAVALNSQGVLAAQVNVFVSGAFDSTVDIVGDGDAFPIIDLSGFSNVTRIEIVNILDDPSAENGIGWDNFSFTVVPAPGSAALLGVAGIAAVRRRR